MKTSMQATLLCVVLLQSYARANPVLLKEEVEQNDKIQNNSDHDIIVKDTKTHPLRRVRVRRAAVSDPNKLWEDATIPYDIDPDLANQSHPMTVLRISMSEWEKETCITFVKKSPSHVNFVYFTRTDCGCCTPVGNQRNGSQFFSMSPNCTNIGNIMHELGHTIGFYHEQSRPDRDKYVKIHYENIDDYLQHNFKLYRGLYSMGEPYDFESIMHYPLIYPRVSGKKFMSVVANISKETKHKIGQRSYLSKGDIVQTKKLYQCPECGMTITRQNGTLQSPGFNFNTKHNTKVFVQRKFCQWRIIGALTDIIELHITLARIPKNVNCSSYIEVRDGHKHSKLLKKICSKTVKRDILIKSSANRMFVEFNLAPGGRFRSPGFSAHYKGICYKEIREALGNFTSHNFPNPYPILKRCSYLLISSKSKTITLTFHVVDIDENCSNEYIEIRDGHNKTAKTLGKFCGNNKPEDFKSSSNVLLVTFQSYLSIKNKGFNASFISERPNKQKEHGHEKTKEKKKTPVTTITPKKSF